VLNLERSCSILKCILSNFSLLRKKGRSSSGQLSVNFMRKMFDFSMEETKNLKIHFSKSLSYFGAILSCLVFRFNLLLSIKFLVDTSLIFIKRVKNSFLLKHDSFVLTLSCLFFGKNILCAGFFKFCFLKSTLFNILLPVLRIFIF